MALEVPHGLKSVFPTLTIAKKMVISEHIPITNERTTFVSLERLTKGVLGVK